MSTPKLLPIALALCLLPTLQAQPPCTLRLSMDAHNRIHESHHRLTHDALVQRLQAGCPAGSGPMQVFLSASPQASYGAVADLTDLVTKQAPPGTQFGLSLPTTGPAKSSRTPDDENRETLPILSAPSSF